MPANPSGDEEDEDPTEEEQKAFFAEEEHRLLDNDKFWAEVEEEPFDPDDEEVPF